MRNLIIIATILGLMYSCGSSNGKIDKNKNESFCSCFKSTEEPDIDLRTSLCVSDTLNGEEVQHAIVEYIKTCDYFFKSISDLQDSIMYLSAKSKFENHIIQNKITDEEYYTFRENYLISMKHYDSVLMYCDSIQEINPLNIENLFVKGYALEQLERYNEAIEIYKELTDLSGSNRYRVSIAIAEKKSKWK